MSRFTGASLVDINNDGLKDLFVSEACGEPIGNQSGPGGLKYYQNTGIIGNPEFTFQNYVHDISGNKIKQLYLRAQFFDMNNDGLIDIVTGENDFKGVPSELRFYENTGSLKDPKFEDGVVLTHLDGSGIPADYAIQFGIADVDNDGIKDILLNAGHHNIQNTKNWQYESKIGFLKGYLKETSKSEKLLSGTFDNMVVIKNGILKYEGIKAVKLFSVSGKLIKQLTFDEVTSCINFKNQNLLSGIYLIKIHCTNNKLKKVKINLMN